MDSIKINIQPEGDALTIRQGQAPANIEPNGFAFFGNISTVATWLETKAAEIDLLRSVVLVDRKSGIIMLYLNAGQENGRIESTVQAILEHSKYLTDFRINTGHKWELSELARFLKFNRRFFPDTQQNMELVAGLNSFKAKVSRDIEKVEDTRGNHRRLDDKRVDTQLPETFTLLMPLFEGEPAESFDVELHIDEKEGIVRATLHSVSLLEQRENFIEERLNAEIDKFKESGITIIYK